MSANLDAALIAAHAAGDRAGLVTLCAEAAETAATGEGARAFFLTQAWIFALETNHPQAPALAARLAAMGRL